MELATQAEIYTPAVNDNGNYIDRIPNCKNGIRCNCGLKNDRVYDKPASFSAHCKTKSHQKWLEHLNFNKANYFAENEALKQVVKQQQLIIAKLENDIRTRTMTIDILTQQLMSKTTVNDLLDFN